MPRLEEPFCEICANPGTDGICGWCLDREPEIDQIRAPYLYLPSSPIHKAVRLLKYRGIRALAPELADLLTLYMEASPARFDCIVPRRKPSVAHTPSRLQPGRAHSRRLGQTSRNPRSRRRAHPRPQRPIPAIHPLQGAALEQRSGKLRIPPRPQRPRHTASLTTS